MAAEVGAGGFPLVFGLNTFGDTTNDDDGHRASHAQAIRDVVDEGVFAERAGVDFFGIGEHHTDDMPLSAADVALAAIAARTSRIRLGSSVTVLSSDDPVRVFQRYSTLNAISSGRAEVILGRGSSIDSFPLFGYDLNDYEVLFEEKTALFAELLQGGPVTWEGTTRAPLVKQERGPAPGGREAHDLDRGRRLARVGGPRRPARVLADARDHRRLADPVRGVLRALRPRARAFRAGTAAGGIHIPGHIAATDQEAYDLFWPRYRGMFGKRAIERGYAPPTEASFRREIGPAGSLVVGSPATVAPKIASIMTALGASRFDLKYGMGTLSHSALMTNIELYGTEVVPRVRELLAG